MKKVAKLVLWSPITRVVVNEDASYEEIVEAAKSKFKVILENDYTENIEDVIDDLEMPYDPVLELSDTELNCLSKA